MMNGLRFVVKASVFAAGAGAVIGEFVAETLADLEQLMEEARLETYKATDEFDEGYFNAAYRSKLQPYVDICRLVVGAAIAATSRDPTLAISAATNALENNFAGLDLAFEYGGQSEEATIAVKEAILEVMEDIRRNPEEYVKEAVIGAAPYGDIVRKVANGEKVSAVEFSIETGLTFLPIGKIVKVGKQTGGKVVGKFLAAVEKRKKSLKRKVYMLLQILAKII
jgi:hypothetical protein